jgi:hypothetical protein
VTALGLVFDKQGYYSNNSSHRCIEICKQVVRSVYSLFSSSFLALARAAAICIFLTLVLKNV